MHKLLMVGGLTVALNGPFGDASTEPGSATSAAGPPPPVSRVLAQHDQGQGMAGGHQTSVEVGDLVVESPWARESVARTGAAYLTVRNGGDRDDRLIGVSSEVAEKAELHSSEMRDGVMRMRPVEAVVVPAHGEAMLAPGGLHIMLIGLNGPLVEGGSFTLVLELERAGTIEVTATVEDITHTGAEGHHH